MALFTSHTAQLKSGLEYFYTDSGAPANSTDYTTLLLIHGMCITAHTFDRLHRYGPAMNLRIVALNRRDYPGTTPYTDEELEDWNSAKDVAWDRLSSQLGEFTELLIKKENIPKISQDGKRGGIAIIGWSIGNTTAMSLFLDRKLIPYDFLEPYIKDLVLWDPPVFPVGIPLPDDLDFQKAYFPLSGNKPTDEVLHDFTLWAGSYYDQPTDPKSINDLMLGEHTSAPTTEALTTEEFEKHVCKWASARSEMKTELLPVPMKRVADAALLNVSKPETLFPRAHITYISAPKTGWPMWWPYLQMQKVYKDRMAKGEDARRIVFVQVEGGNHFVHWDMPQAFLKAVMLGMNSEDANGEVNRIYA